jgi:hypothetical protein
MDQAFYTNSLAFLDQYTEDTGTIQKLSTMLSGISKPSVHCTVLDAILAPSKTPMARMQFPTSVLRDIIIVVTEFPMQHNKRLKPTDLIVSFRLKLG